MPINGQPNKTINTPPKKNTEPLTFCLPKKNFTVLSRPIIKHKPDMNKIFLFIHFKIKKFYHFLPSQDNRFKNKIPTFPIANNPLSNKSSIPSSKKNVPKPDKPIPISLFS